MKRRPVAAKALLVAMTVHGLVDYLLACTGHYLVFGFALGAVLRVGPTGEPG